MSEFCKNIHNIDLLPVPNLNNSMKLYLKWLKPLVNLEQYEKTEQEVEKFLNDPNSSIVQNALIEKSKHCNDSWLAQWWIDNAYLSTTGPVTPECNAGLELQLEFSRDLSDLKRVAVFMYGLTRTYLEYKKNPNNFFEVKGKKYSLDQLNGIFCSMRSFGASHDEYYISKDFNNQITFLYLNNIYNITVINNEQAIKPDEIYNALLEIVNSEDLCAVNANFLGACCNRREGFKVFEQLKTTNENELLSVYNSIAVVSYDETIINNYSDSILNTFSNKECHNRWHGKGFSAMLTKNTCSIVGDHTYIDGGSEIYVAEQINKFINNLDVGNSTNCTTYQKIEFDLTTKTSLEQFKNEFERYLELTDYDLIEFSIDRNKLREIGILSLDGFMQILFQYAHKQAFNKIVNTYESVDLRNFFRGRTECLRPISSESLKVVASIEENDCANLLENIIASTNEHYKRLKSCQDGHGVNRHLLGLQLQSRQLNLDFSLFDDNGFKVISSNQVSTSSLTNKLVKYFYFQQVTDDGFGVSYQLGEYPKVIVSSKNDISGSRKAFVESFKYALKFLKESLEL